MTTAELPKNVEKILAEMLANKSINITNDLIKEVTNKVSTLAAKQTKPSFKQTFKEGGLFGVVKNIISPPKEQTSVKFTNPLSQQTKDKKEQSSSSPVKKTPDTLSRILIDGITEKGVKDLQLKLPKILNTSILKDLKLTQDKETENRFKLPKIPDFKDIFKNLRLPKIPDFKLPDFSKFKKSLENLLPRYDIFKPIKNSLNELKNKKWFGNLLTPKEKKESAPKDGFLERFKKGGLFGLFGPKEKKESKSQVDLIKDEEAPQKVLLHGITDEGFKSLERKLPDLLKGILGKGEKPKDKEEKKKWGEGGLLSLLGPGLLGVLKGALMAGGGIALLLGGVAALVTGLQTDGPFKGLLKIFSKVGIMGGLKLLEKGALTFIKNMKSLVNAPVNLLKTAYKGLRSIFGKGIAKTITTAIGKSAGLFTKMASGLLKFLAPLLRRIPLVGTVISLGFAYTRFKKGDIIGGVIDVLSGIANAFAVVPGFGLIGSGIALGLDVLNAFLDYKAGGSSAEASKKKGGLIGDFFKGLAGWIYEKSKYLPVIGRLIKAGEAFYNKDWAKGLTQLSRIIPGTGWVMDLFGYTEEKQEQVVGGQLKVMEDLTSYIKTIIWDKVFGFASRTWNAAKEWWNNAKNWWNEKTQAVGDFFGKIGSDIKDFAVNLKDKITNTISDYASKIKDGVKNWWSNTKNWWSEVKEEVSNSYLGKQFSALMSWMKNKVWDRVTGFASKTWESIKGWWSKITDWWGNDKVEAPADVEQSSSNVISDLMSWMKTSVWDKVTNFFGNITDSIKGAISNYVDNLSLDPRSWVGMAPEQPKLDPNDIGLAEGGIVSPTPGGRKVTVAEGGEHEVVAPLSKLDQILPEGSKTEDSDTTIFNKLSQILPEGLKVDSKGIEISNNILKDVASNTANTNDTLDNLSQAIFKLASIFDKKQNSNNNNIVIAGGNQPKQQYPTASQVAASNVDPIRAIRAQFAV